MTKKKKCLLAGHVALLADLTSKHLWSPPVWVICGEQDDLIDEKKYDEPEGVFTESNILQGVMPQCRTLSQLNLICNQIGPAGAEFLAGMLGYCEAMVHETMSHLNFGGIRSERLGQTGTQVV
jgi:hypothetical protein